MKFSGKVVKQLWMGRRLSGLSEVVDRADESLSKDVMPESVHIHAGGQRIA